MGKGASPNFQPSHSALCFPPSLVRRILPMSTGLQKPFLPCGEAVIGHCWVRQSCSWCGDAWPGKELERLGRLGQGGLAPRGACLAETPWQPWLLQGVKLPGRQGWLRADEGAQDSHSAIRGPPPSGVHTSALHCSAACFSCPTFISMVHGWSLAFYAVSQWVWYGEFRSISYSVCVSSYHWRVS